MRASALLSLILALVPRLATLTYAAPHLIASHSVAGVISVRRPVVRPPKPAPKPIDEKAARTLFERPNLLVKTADDDAWRIAPPSGNLFDAEISDARLSQQQPTAGTNQWTVEAPITFEYKVREVPGVLDPASDALLFGFIDDAATLEIAKARALKRVVVVDETVFSLYGDAIEAYFEHHGVTTKLLVLPTTEENKNMELVLKIAEAIHDLGIDRRLDPVIAIGGGVCMDIVGFAASIYRRRTPYVRVPTTLMGYVDASVGAKTGVNFEAEPGVWKKNKLGAYLPPAITLLDRSFLATLDERQLANGAAEIVKMAIVKDPELLDLLAAHGPELIEHKFQKNPYASSDAWEADDAASRVLYLAIETMLEELAPNLWEDSLERLVDFGHVFSMELEMALVHQGDEKLFHGEAVAIDMAFSSVLAHVRGHLESETLDLILQTMRGLSLPVYHERFDSPLTAEAIYERVKFSQGQKIPLPAAHGAARLYNDVTQEEMDAALALWKEMCA